jgi:hypothetical protein
MFGKAWGGVKYALRRRNQDNVQEKGEKIEQERSALSINLLS